MAGDPLVEMRVQPGEVADVGLVVHVRDRATELAVLNVLQRDLPQDGPRVDRPQVATSGDHCVAGRGVILVLPPTAAACAAAVRSVVAGMTAAALTTDELDRLTPVVAAVESGVKCLSPEVVRLSSQMPEVAERAHEVLALAATGASVAEMASQLHLSTATIKRELAELTDSFGVRSRVELILHARRLGLL